MHRRIHYGVAVAESRPGQVPRARLERALYLDGGSALPDLELLSLVLGPSRGRPAREAARRVLEEAGWGSLSLGGGRPVWWGLLGRAQASRLAAALELARRLAGPEGAVRPVLRTPREVYEATADLRSERREHFVGLFLNTRNRLLVRETISVGSLNASIVHPREVFEPAIRHGAASLIVVHNHPSGETDPSEDDLGITRRLREAGDILGITLLDHVIVGGDGYTSLKEEREL
jgi:DNA repair protein RadC